MNLNINTWEAEDFRKSIAVLPVGGYQLHNGTAEVAQYVYLTGMGDLITAVDHDDLIRIIRRRNGDHYTAAFELAQKTVVDEVVKIHHVIGIAKAIQTRTGTELDANDRNHDVYVRFDDLICLDRNGVKYLVYHSPDLEGIANIVRERNGKLVTAVPGIPDWVYL